MQDFETGTHSDNIKLIGDRGNVRTTFLRKLYSLIAIQFAFATLVQYFSINNDDFAAWVSKNWGYALANGVQLVLVLISVYFFRNFFRKAPINVIIYAYFTILLCYMIVYFTRGQIWLMATSSLCILCVALFSYALTSRTDLTFIGGTIYVLGAGLVTYGLFLIATDVQFFTIVCLVLGIIILGFYLIYDTRYLIVGQSFSSEMEDPFIGSIVLYIDLFLIVFRVIALLGKVFKTNRY